MMIKDDSKKKTVVTKGLKIMNHLAMFTAVNSANAACGWIYHQPEEPEEIKKFRKF